MTPYVVTELIGSGNGLSTAPNQFFIWSTEVMLCFQLDP